MVIEPLTYYKLKSQFLEANLRIDTLRRQAAEIERARDDALRAFCLEHGFVFGKTFTFRDEDHSIETRE